MIYIAGPGPWRPGLVANTYLEGTYSEVYPEHLAGRRRACRRCSSSSPFPAAFRAMRARDARARSTKAASSAIRCRHAFGAAFDNPDLIVACVVGDGEAETGPLATAWHSNKFLNPARDGAVLPILHLNGYKIANPTVLARISRRGAGRPVRGYGYEPYFVEGDEPRRDAPARWRRRSTTVVDEIRAIQAQTRASNGDHDASALADDRAAHAQGLDRAQGGRRQEDRGLLGARIRCRSPSWREARSISSCSKSG